LIVASNFSALMNYLYKTSNKNEPFYYLDVYGMKSSMKKSKNYRDANLVIAYQNGNKDAASLLVKRWHVEFCKFSFWICKDKDVAKDIAQESWMLIFKKLHELNDPNKFKSWSISIVNRKTIDWIRKTNREQHKLHKFYDDIPKNIPFEKEVNQTETLITKMKFEIDQLPEHQQVVLKLFYTEEYSLKQISKLLDISVGTAKSRLFHARERLKQKVKNRSERF